ncbi:MAG: NUDIX hydrolase [bacterium]
MYVTETIIDSLSELYGVPQRAELTFPVSRDEYDRIRASQKNGRQHDFTLYIVKDHRIVVIAKHFYPPGLYRAPSGGAQPGEEILDAIHREVMEETGCYIKLEKFLLRTKVVFTCSPYEIAWNSFVLQAAYISGDFKFTDHREIREVRLAEPVDFQQFSAIMRKSNIGGLHYRAALHDRVKILMKLQPTSW